MVDEAKVQLQAFDVHKTLKSCTSIDFKTNAYDFTMTYQKLQKVIQTKDIEKLNKRKYHSPDSPGTDGTGESKESRKEAKVNGFAMDFLEEILEFLREKFTSIPWSKERLVFAV